jgi:hypothetical protein
MISAAEAEAEVGGMGHLKTQTSVTGTGYRRQK